MYGWFFEELLDEKTKSLIPGIVEMSRIKLKTTTKRGESPEGLDSLGY